MAKTLLDSVKEQLASIRLEGLYKEERVIESPQGDQIETAGRRVINLCANNYLGLSNHPDLIAAAKKGLTDRGYGYSSVRFICGTSDVHKELEHKLSEFLGTEDTILYSSCFDANGGLFEALLTDQDAILSDELNHASIIDGIRLCKAKRFRYKNNDMGDLERCLKEAQSARHRLIATDGVFSMDGSYALLDQICDLAAAYDAYVMVDDSHAVGFVGANGRGCHEKFAVMDRVDLITGTLGKALGGASGGYTSGRGPLIELLRQRSRPYLFSNTLAPMIAKASIKALEIVNDPSRRNHLKHLTQKLRTGLGELGFEIMGADHPIVPVLIKDAKKAGLMAEALLELGIYVTSFSYPVVPKDKARIRMQLSAAHTDEELELALDAFAQIGRRYGLIA